MAGFLGKLFSANTDTTREVKLGVLKSVEMAQDSFDAHFPAARYLFSSVLHRCVWFARDPKIDDEDERQQLERNMVVARESSLNTTQGLDLAAMKLGLLYIHERRRSPEDREVLSAFNAIFDRAATGSISYRGLVPSDSLPPTNARTARILQKVGIKTVREMIERIRQDYANIGMINGEEATDVNNLLAGLDIDDECRSGAQYGPIKIIRDAVNIDDFKRWGKPFSMKDHIMSHLVGR